MEKINALFNNSLKSLKNVDLDLREVIEDDLEEIIQLKQTRDVKTYEELRDETLREFNAIKELFGYKLFIAITEERICGFARIAFYTEKNQNLYNSPIGWWFQGVVVHPDFRRRSIARALSNYRFSWLKNRGVKKVYSSVDHDNIVSLRMHKKFGFIKDKKINGVFKHALKDGKGFLLYKNL